MRKTEEGKNPMARRQDGVNAPTKKTPVAGANAPTGKGAGPAKPPKAPSPKK